MVFNHVQYFSKFDWYFSTIYSLYLVALNRSDAVDSDIKKIIDIIVDSLFSVFVTAGMLHVHVQSRAHNEYWVP